MINRKITVTYEFNKITKEFCENAMEKYPNCYNYDLDDPNHISNWIDGKITFESFTNTGKVSKSEFSKKRYKERFINFVKPIAERKFAEEIAKEKMLDHDRDKDTARALELKAIVDNANWENIQDKDLAVIKTKMSHSKWYSNGEGQLHSLSEYLTVVPVSVAKEAIELQKIRRKHQDDPKFDFWRTSYKCREIRVADHDNQDSYSEIDPTYENWENIFNCDFLPDSL
ncbi:hypothetical protein [uncultured Lactobacillus sp.]|uniref:hypothetical protein n=1 Tax=uncultured Lactobacillus sp. TaxID=153152 RepID=UPI0025D3664E|nr:hypothetical protein [uncultured Lactobacillus sp.]